VGLWLVNCEDLELRPATLGTKKASALLLSRLYGRFCETVVIRPTVLGCILFVVHTCGRCYYREGALKL